MDRSLSDTVTWSATYTKNLGAGVTGFVGIESSDERDQRVFDGTAAVAHDGGLPAVIAGLGYNQGWGSLNLHGAVKEVTAAGAEGEFGYAVQGTAKFNLDMLTAGSSIVFNAAYTDGALSYVGARSDARDFDGVLNGNKIETTKAYSLGAGVIFQVMEDVSLRAEGTYLDVDAFGSALDYDRYAVAGSVDWTPAAGLRIAGVLSHAKNDFADVAVADEEETRFTVRVQHDF
ncbi:hypothetical protein E1162_09170 [Rhodobacteraceae bacterium RKSG542]|nr:hypothetical protein [Pseudovibrio flavus]